MKASKPQKKAHRPMAVVPILGKGHRHRSPKDWNRQTCRNETRKAARDAGFSFSWGGRHQKASPSMQNPTAKSTSSLLTHFEKKPTTLAKLARRRNP